jgi:hypothetical protein
MPESDPIEKPHWTVDRRVPLALVIMLLAQTGGAVWWTSSLNSRVSSLEEWRQETIPRRELRDKQYTEYVTTTTELKANVNNLNTLLGRLTDTLDGFDARLREMSDRLPGKQGSLFTKDQSRVASETVPMLFPGGSIGGLQ